MMKRADGEMNDALQYIVPVSHGGNMYGFASYNDNKEPAIWEKQNYAKLLTGQNLTPVIDINNNDIQIMKDKRYLAQKRDFHNYLGELFKPNENPVNAAYLKQICPDYFKDEVQTIDNWHKTHAEIQKLLVTGGKNFEELFTLYRLGYKPGEGIGMDTSHPMGRNEEFIKQMANDQAPNIEMASNMSPLEANINFQRGIFNTNRKEVESKALMGYTGSVFPGQSGTRLKDNMSIKKRFRDPFAQPDMRVYNKPKSWSNMDQADYDTISAAQQLV